MSYHLAYNQSEKIKCGDNGIFKACKVSKEEQTLTNIVKKLFSENPNDGKYIIDEVTCKCAIGDIDLTINGTRISYEEVTNEALKYINDMGGFEKLAEWGLIR